MRIRVIIKYDKKTKSYAAFCPELPGCTSHGDTEKEVMKNIREAIELYLEPSTKLARKLVPAEKDIKTHRVRPARTFLKEFKVVVMTKDIIRKNCGILGTKGKISKLLAEEKKAERKL